ncbi:hypothetical protein CsSME_00003093 [Camellia sinensis var. sinensis]
MPSCLNMLPYVPTELTLNKCPFVMEAANWLRIITWKGLTPCYGTLMFCGLEDCVYLGEGKRD